MEREASTQQPMSLMTIDARSLNARKHGHRTSRNETNEDAADLLTLRILEASERKMQLIRQLLTPEQYNSLSSDFFTTQRDFLLSTQSLSAADRHNQSFGLPLDEEHRLAFASRKQTKSVPSDLAASSSELSREQSARFREKIQAENAFEYREINADIALNLEESLERKRRAVEFFFADYDRQKLAVSQGGAKNLAIELRFGHYLNQDREAESNCLTTPSQPTFVVGILVGIWQLLVRLCRSCLSRSGWEWGELAAHVPGQDEGETLYIRRYKAASCLPYARETNLLAMRDRLRADAHLERVANLKSPSPVEQTSTEIVTITKASQLRRLDLSKCRAQQIIINHIKAPCTASRRAARFNFQGPQIIVHHPMVDNFWGLRRDDMDWEWEREWVSNEQSKLQLKVRSIRLTSHRLMSEEEKLVAILENIHNDYASEFSRLERLNLALDEFSTDRLRSESSSLNDFNKYIKLSKLERRLLESVAAKQQELESIWSRIVVTRSEQKFTSTGVHLAEIELDDSRRKFSRLRSHTLQEVFTRRFGQSTDSDGKQMGDVGRVQSELSRQLKMDTDYEILRTRFVLRRAPLVARHQELPDHERDRRRKLLSWLNSLHLRVALGDGRVLQRIKLFNEDDLDFANGQSEVMLQNCRVDLPTRASRPIKLMIHLISLRRSPMNLGLKYAKAAGLAEASADLAINPGEIPEASIQLIGRTNDATEPTSAVLKLESEPTQWTDSMKPESTIEKLHENFFSTHFIANKLDDMQTRLGNLIKRVDTSLLARLLAGFEESSYCVLDPFGADFCQRPLHAVVPAEISGRLALLAWRWLVDHQTRVYLSERENVNLVETAFDTQALKTKLERRLKQPEVVGYKLIELIRTEAIDRIGEMEQLIARALEVRHPDASGSLAEGNTVRLDRLKDVLVEPKLEIKIDFRRWARTLRAFVPRRTARRPLMADRGARRRRRQATKLGQLVELSQRQQTESPNPSGSDRQSGDIEQEAFSHWKSSTQSSSRQTGDINLRLLVTIQQAYNVPMRVLPTLNYPVSHPRSSSPFFAHSPSSSSLGPARRPTSPLFGQQQQAYLAPPASYVEVIFQRKQLTTSLAQSESPAWNETLFFNVEVGGQAPPNGGPLGHLVDEFLQVNLYDCRCYVQECDGGEFAPISPSQMSTMLLANETPLMSPTHDSPNAPMNATPSRLVSTQRQRIERHLIGSLTLPLSVLLSNGRIEGSFTLNQPLLLENYHLESDPTLKTQLSLFITLDPAVWLPLRIYLPLDSVEHRDVFCYARFWEQLITSNRSLGRLNKSRRWRRDNFARPPLNGSGLRTLELDARALAASSSGQASRHVRALILGEDGRYRLLSRYLGPLRPPSIGQEAEAAGHAVDIQMKRLARFVSLLSPVKHGLFKMRLLASNIWFDAQHLLHESLGGQEEKAILLCNYFLNLGKCSALVLGDAIPDGRCVYVLVWREQLKRDAGRLEAQLSDLLENLAERPPDGSVQPVEPIDQENFLMSLPILINSKSVQIWEPNLGTAHGLNDGSLQLISVGAIVTCENIYANIQMADAPNELSYDIRQKNLWFPLLNQLNGQREHNSTASFAIESTLRRDQRRISQMNSRRQLNYLEQLAKQLGRPAIAPILAPSSPLDYSTLTPVQCAELKTAIEQSIKAHLLTWRPDRPTYFNRTLSRILADRLATFERAYFLQAARGRGSTISTNPLEEEASHFADWRADLAHLIKREVLNMPSQLNSSDSGLASAMANQIQDRQVISWPVNLTYTNIRSILDALFSSGVHNADLVLDNIASNPADQSATSSQHLSTQFLVACHVEAYPARVVSVWLYVGAIVTNPSANRFKNALL